MSLRLFKKLFSNVVKERLLTLSNKQHIHYLRIIIEIKYNFKYNNKIEKIITDCVYPIVREFLPHMTNKFVVIYKSFPCEDDSFELKDIKVLTKKRIKIE